MLGEQFVLSSLYEDGVFLPRLSHFKKHTSKGSNLELPSRLAEEAWLSSVPGMLSAESLSKP